MEGSDVYTDTFCLTSVNMEELATIDVEKVTGNKSSKISHETAFNATCHSLTSQLVTFHTHCYMKQARVSGIQCQHLPPPKSWSEYGIFYVKK
jgi:hypothetical protein